MVKLNQQQMFICFAAEDRYTIAESLVYHLKNYGITVWYDRHMLVMGDNRIEKNLIDGATSCKYAIAVLSTHTELSPCAMEELAILKERHTHGAVTVFPILFELSPDKLPYELQWIKELIFKEVTRNSGTREICNHIACKVTADLLGEHKCIDDIITDESMKIPPTTQAILKSYQAIDHANLNSRVSLLYAAYLSILHFPCSIRISIPNIVSMVFNRLFSETQLNLAVDYREIWLLENSLCLLVDCYIRSCTESSM